MRSMKGSCLQFVVFSLVLWVMTFSLATAGASVVESQLKVVSLDFGNYIQLDYPLWVKIDNLASWLRYSDGDTSKFVVCFDGVPFNGPSMPEVRADSYLGFSIKPCLETKNAWKNLISPPLRRDGETVHVTVRLNGTTLEGGLRAKLTVFPKPEIYIFLVLMILVLIVFVWLAATTDIIREPGDQPAGMDEIGRPNRKPYSLGRTQMASWFFVILGSYFFIWMLTSDIKTLTPTALLLLGISSATALGSAVVDSSRRSYQDKLLNSMNQKLKQHEVEVSRLKKETTLGNEVSAINHNEASVEQERVKRIAKEGELAGKIKEIAQAEEQVKDFKERRSSASSKGFLNDILNDDSGISFHRFQMFAWTLVLIMIFLWSVLRSLTMMDFDSELLALMGVSGGTFIGFKLPAQQG